MVQDRAGAAPSGQPGSPWSALVRWTDVLQRRHRILGFPWAVVRKYFDDDGGSLAALITYYGFLSLFPLLLLAMTAVTELLRSRPELQRQLVEELVNPELRPDVEQALAQLPSGGVPLAVGLVGLVFAGTGGVLAVYSALNTVWGVPWRDRFGLTRRSSARSWCSAWRSSVPCWPPGRPS